jgi:serine/threonine protein kinase
MIPPGAVIGGYRIDRVIGTGAMGTVYAAADPHLPRLDALKVLSAHLSADHDFRARFLRESDIVAGLDHPNIVSIYNRGETPQGQLWIAMQLVDGADADQALSAGTMTVHRAVHIISEVAAALDYAHGRGVIHRDIKPANFLLSGSVGPEERVLLGDFGIARALDDTGITAAGSVVATAAFAAPEAVSGGMVDARSDLYALGASLYRLLTGHNPFQGDTLSAQMMAHLHQPAPQITTLAPWLPPAFDTLIATAMAKNPHARYQSGHVLAAAAQAALRELHAPPDPAAATQVAPTLSPAQPWTDPPVGGNPPTWGPPGYPPPSGYLPPQRPLPQRRNHTRTAAVAAAAVVVLVAGVTTAVLMTRGGSTADTSAATATAVTSSTASVTISTTTTAPPPPPPPPPPVAPVDDADLPGLLLPPDQLTAILGANLTAKPGATGIANDSAAVTPDECISALIPAQRLALDNSGFRAGYSQQFVPDLQAGASAAQAVVSFPTPEMATAFVAHEEQLWQPCAHTILTVRGNGGSPDKVYQLGAPSNVDGILSLISTRDDKPVQCQHAITARGNVVVDVYGCLSPGVTDQGIAIARALADRIK